MRVLLDTNVILDSMLQRPPWHLDADAILQAAGRGEVTCAVTALSLANLFYIGRRIVGTSRARTDVRTCLHTLQILAVDRQVLVDADVLGDSDFEDNIQIAAAVAVALDAVVTRDPSGFSHAPIAVWSPSILANSGSLSTSGSSPLATVSSRPASRYPSFPHSLEAMPMPRCDITPEGAALEHPVRVLAEPAYPQVA